LATVYGHISRILVKEGDLVRAGDLIGLSGGIPGTPGAGYMTTGAHLHFEVIDHGEHKNPLDYLPLEKMRLEDIPQRYMSEAVKL
ncbi:MAG: M23 family metallopeptidase, partial [Patescibacteria group bacterium]